MAPPPFGVCLVGYGFAGRVFHAPLLDACPDLELRSVVTSRVDTLADDRPGVRAVATLDEALADPGIDLVVVATPNGLHFDQARAALQAGKAVVVDKPLTLRLADARALADLAADRGLFLSVFQNRRWDADFLALKQQVESGALGRLITLESRFDRFRPEVRDRWRERDELGGGLWFDIASHQIDQAVALFGRPLGVTADLAALRQGGLAADWVHAVLRYADKRVVVHCDLTTAAADLRFAAHGDQGSWIKTGFDVQESQLVAEQPVGGPGWGVDPRPGVRVDGKTGERTPVEGPPGDYPAYYAAVARTLAGRGDEPVPVDQALTVVEILEAGVESSRVRAEVTLPA